MYKKKGAIHDWWPSTQSLDLVQGPARNVAEAVEAELQRFIAPEVVTAEWERFSSLNDAFRSVCEFTNVPTQILVLPTKSNWSVLWNNSFLCDGYDSLCSCLTRNAGLTTIHWSAHDQQTTFQPGAFFCYRSLVNGMETERLVQVAKEDNCWHFYQMGEPLPEENTDAYAARLKKDRLNEKSLLQLLSDLGASPWDERFYDLSESVCVLRRMDMPSTIICRNREDILVPPSS